jgi:hypothetical protein
MGGNEVLQSFGACRLGVGVVRGTEHGDEDVRIAHFTGIGIDDRNGGTGVVDEQLVAGEMTLTQAASLS